MTATPRLIDNWPTDRPPVGTLSWSPSWLGMRLPGGCIAVDAVYAGQAEQLPVTEVLYTESGTVATGPRRWLDRIEIGAPRSGWLAPIGIRIWLLEHTRKILCTGADCAACWSEMEAADAG